MYCSGSSGVEGASRIWMRIQWEGSGVSVVWIISMVTDWYDVAREYAVLTYSWRIAELPEENLMMSLILTHYQLHLFAVPLSQFD